MRKLLLILLFIPSLAQAWEVGVGFGGWGRDFDPRDQLGAFSPEEGLKPKNASGFEIHSYFLFDLVERLRIGPDLSIHYGWIRAPKQERLDVNNLNVGTVIIGTTLEREGAINVAITPGFVVNTLTTDWVEKVDADTGFSLSIKTSAELYGKSRFFIKPQIIVAPSVEGKNEFVGSFALVVGVEAFCSSNPPREQKINKTEPIAPIHTVDLPKEATPASVELPKETTPIKVEPKEAPQAPQMPQEPPKLEEPPVEPPIQKEELVAPPKPKKMVLKFDGNDLSPDSIGFLENIVRIQKENPSIIRVHYSRGKNAKKKAKVLYDWFINYGVQQEEVQLVDKLKGREIKIEVILK